MNKLTLEDLELEGKRVLMRVDFNVPLADGKVANNKRIRAALPSIQYVLKNHGRLILMSHLGRPKGKRVPEMSLKPCAEELGKLLEREVAFVDDCIGEKATSAAQHLAAGEILLLENLRYHPEETDNNDAFAAQLAALGDVYVNDAFGTAHRAHASTEGVTRHIPSCAAGYLLMKEINYLGKVVEKPERPFVAILGGAKISGKIDVIANLLPKVDRLIIGGGMAYTFFKAMGFEIGKSLLESDKIDLAKKLLEQGHDKIELPVDCLVSDHFDMDRRAVGSLKIVPRNEIPADCMGLDIGPQTTARFDTIIRESRTVVWNGPMGVFEIDETAKGTFAIAKALAEATISGTITVVGGGDSASAVEKAGVEKQVSHVSTGGGASLEFLEGKLLPGVVALTDK